MFFRKKREKEKRPRESFDPGESFSDTPSFKDRDRPPESSRTGRDLEDPTILPSSTRPPPRGGAPAPHLQEEAGEDVTRFIGAPVPYGAAFVAWLVHASGAQRGKDIRLSGGTTRIGSGRECEISISGDTYISSRHAELSFSGGLPHLRDLQSTNGTFVNGEMIREVDLADGDRVRIGATELVFKCVHL
jgi:hypothetical protein